MLKIAEGTKQCAKCKEIKSLSEFYKASHYFINPRINKTRTSNFCKACVYVRAKANRQANLDRYKGYIKRWELDNPSRRKEILKKYRLSPKGVYNNLTKRGKENVLISQEEFIQWYHSQIKACYYCGIPEFLVSKFSKGKLRSRLTIDRIKPKGSYALGNIVLACGTCNFVKSDVFNEEEMLEIGLIINKKWKNGNKNS